MFFNRFFVLFAIVLYSLALITPHHFARPHHHHRAIAPRLAASLADPLPLEPRRLSKRCKHRHSAPHLSAPDQPSSTWEPKATTPPSPPPPATTTTSTPSTTEEAPTAPTHSYGGKTNLPSFMVGMQTGQGTYYAPGLGACGIVNSNTDHIAAVSHLLFDAFPGYNGINPNTNPVCGMKVKVFYQGRAVTVTITDRCVGCDITSLDMSPGAFDNLADEAVGRLFNIHWHWLFV
ncbi:hypothetical protein APHAL10511_006318 [Amanita phalloides]|nr:hypothetical protein APHAL10511_006318 [Amanita phalloides]